MILKMLFFFLAAFFLTKLFYKPLKKDFTTKRQNPENKPATAVEALTVCPACSVYFQKRQGVFAGSQHYCSQLCAHKSGKG